MKQQKIQQRPGIFYNPADSTSSSPTPGLCNAPLAPPRCKQSHAPALPHVGKHGELRLDVRLVKHAPLELPRLLHVAIPAAGVQLHQRGAPRQAGQVAQQALVAEALRRGEGHVGDVVHAELEDD